MPDPGLIATLERLEKHLSAALHEHRRQLTAIRRALPRLRNGENPRLVSARLEADCPELREKIGL